RDHDIGAREVMDGYAVDPECGAVAGTHRLHRERLPAHAFDAERRAELVDQAVHRAGQPFREEDAAALVLLEGGDEALLAVIPRRALPRLAAAHERRAHTIRIVQAVQR